MSCLILFKSITYAQRAMKILERHGISVSMIRKPAQIRGNGCGYALLIDRKMLISATNILNSSNITYLGAWAKFKGEWVALE